MRIVVVEDEAITRMAIAESLVEDGMEVSDASDGTAFMALLAGTETRPVDILMVDVNLGGGMSGFDVANVARGRWPEVTVVYITGDLRAVVKTSGQRDLCLLKPFTEQALRYLVRSIPAIRTGPA